MNLSLVLLYIHLGLIPDLCFIANILFLLMQNISLAQCFPPLILSGPHSGHISKDTYLLLTFMPGCACAKVLQLDWLEDDLKVNSKYS